MTQALSEFRSPVGQEALRLRMVAMHGREDPLLDIGRFARLLRQANDAEVAEVRKVGDDDYEITAQRAPARPLPPPATGLPAGTSQEEALASGVSVEPGAEAASPGRDNGQRLGLRFRRGSRGPARAGEIPLIGVVRIEPPAEAAQPQETMPSETIAELPGAELPGEEKPARPRRPRGKRITTPVAEPPTGDEEGGAGPPRAKRPRTRSRKKAE
jgi:hypothetical protein